MTVNVLENRKIHNAPQKPRNITSIHLQQSLPNGSLDMYGNRMTVIRVDGGDNSQQLSLMERRDSMPPSPIGMAPRQQIWQRKTNYTNHDSNQYVNHAAHELYDLSEAASSSGIAAGNNNGDIEAKVQRIVTESVSAWRTDVRTQLDNVSNHLATIDMTLGDLGRLMRALQTSIHLGTSTPPNIPITVVRKKHSVSTLGSTEARPATSGTENTATRKESAPDPSSSSSSSLKTVTPPADGARSGRHHRASKKL